MFCHWSALMMVVACLSAQPANAEWRVEAHHMNGESASGACIGLDADTLRIRRDDGTIGEWPRAELISIDAIDSGGLVSLPFPIDPAVTRVDSVSAGLLVLANDDRLVIAAAKISELGLTVEHSASGSSIDVPWESLSYWMQTPHPPSTFLIAGQTVRSDRLVLSNGDVISGELTQFGGEGVSMETTSGLLAIASERIVALSTNPELTSLPRLPDSWLLLQLTDGSRLTATDCELRDDVVRLELHIGAEIALPAVAVHSLWSFSDRVINLTSLSHSSWEHELFVPSRLEGSGSAVDESSSTNSTNLLERANPAWNRSPLGGALRIGGIEFPRGVGMRPRARLTFPIGGEFQSFQSTVGLDDLAGDRGSVEFRVESAGEVLWKSPALTGQDEPLNTGLIDIRGRNELTLVVDFAEWGDVHDLADWGNPVLLRETEITRPQ